MTTFADEEMFPNQVLEKVRGGYRWSLNYDLFEMYFDNSGKYVRQVQEDMIEGGFIHLVSRDVEPLTSEQMKLAIN